MPRKNEMNNILHAKTTHLKLRFYGSMQGAHQQLQLKDLILPFTISTYTESEKNLYTNIQAQEVSLIIDANIPESKHKSKRLQLYIC